MRTILKQSPLSQKRAALMLLGAIVSAIAGAGALAQKPSPSESKPATRTMSIRLDPATTSVTFTAGTLKHVHGTLALKTGIFAVDSKSGVAQGEILVDAASEKSNDPKLDAKLQKDTLETGKYPQMFFHAEKVEGSLPATDGERQIKLLGSFNIHGADHPLTVDVDVTKKGSDYLFRTSFTVPYVKWGLKDASTLLMRDHNIKVTVESHGTVEEAHSNS